MTSTITAEDVKNVAMDIHVEITDEDVQDVLDIYDIEQNADPSAHWTLVVEDLIFSIINKKN